MKDCLLSRNKLVEYANNSIVGIDANDIMRFPCEKVVEQEPCEDAVSRNAIIQTLNNMDRYVANERTLCDTNNKFPQNEVFIVDDVYEQIAEQLPSVTPQQKIGHWIESTGYDNRDHFYTCSECGRNINLICGAKLTDYPYCHCGAKMEVNADDSNRCEN